MAAERLFQRLGLQARLQQAADLWARRQATPPQSPGLEAFLGCDGAKRELADVAEFLRQPARYRRLGAGLPSGILLYGPPQGGKGRFAAALAGEARAPLQYWSPADGQHRLESILRQLRREPRQVLYLRRLERFPPRRLERLEALWRRDQAGWPLLVGGSSEPERLAPQWLRPGRLERPVLIEYPERAARLRLLRELFDALPGGDDIGLQQLASASSGCSVALLRRLANEVALAAGRAGQPRVDRHSLERAWRQLTGQPLTAPPASARVLACHQAGHALIAGLLPRAAPPEQASILAGHVAYSLPPPSARPTLQQSYLLDRIGVLLAGRISEGLLLGEYSNAAGSDLRQAAALAQHMVASWGMGERLGPLPVAPGPDHILSESTARLVDDEVRRVLNEVEAAVKETLERHRHALERLSEALLSQESLGGGEIAALLDGLLGRGSQRPPLG